MAMLLFVGSLPAGLARTCVIDQSDFVQETVIQVQDVAVEAVDILEEYMVHDQPLTQNAVLVVNPKADGCYAWHWETDSKVEKAKIIKTHFRKARDSL